MGEHTERAPRKPPRPPVTVMAHTATITTWRDVHRRWCNYSGRGDTSTWALPGEVRRCPHGLIQLAYEVPGSAAAYWRDLSPILTPVKDRRARRALAHGDGHPRRWLTAAACLSALAVTVGVVYAVGLLAGVWR
jgi:hypothetical protein